jgi:hypothetical protein
MKPNDEDIEEILRTQWKKPPEEDVLAAKRRVLERLRARYQEVKGEWETLKALRKVLFEPLRPGDLVVLNAVKVRRGEGDSENVTQLIGQWFPKEFPREAVKETLDRLEGQGFVSAADRPTFAITAEGETALDRGKAEARRLAEALEQS